MWGKFCGVNAFVRMGVAVGLEFSEEAVRAAFRVEAGRVHPDAGGDEGDFAAVQIGRAHV